MASSRRKRPHRQTFSLENLHVAVGVRAAAEALTLTADRPPIVDVEVDHGAVRTTDARSSLVATTTHERSPYV